MDNRVKYIVIAMDVLCWGTLALLAVHHFNCPLTF
jgi:hypothetical protein